MIQSKKYCLDCFQIIEAKIEVCPQCGFNQPQTYEHNYLKPPFRLNKQYIIGRVLGHGGFAITYLAYDKLLAARVAIKEYFPTEFATRAQDGINVAPYSGQKSELFRLGKEKFIAEARLLSSLRSNHIVRIRHFFEECNTAYFIMEYLDGGTLTEYVAAQGGRISIEKMKTILFPLLEALKDVHKKSIFHRDIKPDNIYLARDGLPILIDFGAARQQMSGATTNLLAFLTPGFAPAEQYSTNGIQGAWTDIYAMGATVYYCITGLVPPVPQDRALGEAELTPPSQLGIEISPHDEAWLLKAMEIKWSQRPESVEEWQAMMVTDTGTLNEQSLKLAEEENFVKIAILPRLTSRFLTPEFEKEIYEAAGFMEISKERVEALIEETLLKTGSTRRDPQAEKRKATSERQALEKRLQAQEEERKLLEKIRADKEQLASNLRQDQESREREELKRERLALERELEQERQKLEAERKRLEEARKAQEEELKRLREGKEILLDGDSHALDLQAKELAKKEGVSFKTALKKLTGDLNSEAAKVPPIQPPKAPIKPPKAPIQPPKAPPLKPPPAPAFKQNKSAAPEARALNIPAKFTNSLGMDFVLVTPYDVINGKKISKRFAVGDKKTPYFATLTQAFYLQTTPVTQGQWQMVMGDNPAASPGDQWLPIENISWDQSQAFMQRLNTLKEGFYRLPTEAEWEYACRQGKDNQYFFGDDDSQLLDYAWFEFNAQNKTHPVGLKKPNPAGLYDMYGNVWEWVQDRFAPYPEGEYENPKGPSKGLMRVLRGGAFSLNAEFCRAGGRYFEKQDKASPIIGFRLLMEVVLTP